MLMCLHQHYLSNLSEVVLPRCKNTIQIVFCFRILGGLIASNIDTCIKILNKGLIKGIIKNNDLNDLTNIGYYFIHTGNTNAPTSSSWYFMEVYNFSAIYIIQRATVWNNPLKVYQRTRTDSGWAEWVQL